MGLIFFVFVRRICQLVNALRDLLKPDNCKTMFLPLKPKHNCFPKAPRTALLHHSAGVNSGRLLHFKQVMPQQGR